ncbi:MAG TPA: hypothetical protein VMS04_15600 [Vicinamibacterales bacterium]|jgi:hypothetical protein|nr:hypothetical protein [Vicinamibacterales bacterium]
MVSGALIGDRELVARLGRLPEQTRRDVRDTVIALGFELQRIVQTQYLDGQALRVRTGRLSSSIGQRTARSPGDTRTRFEDSGDRFDYYVGTNVSYGRAWELGFTTPAFTVYPKTAKALRFEVGGQVVFAAHANIPAKSHAARPFLAPALADITPLATQKLGDALTAAARKVMG